mmetsp:Transcript_26457/g.50244  ORF Transcript_26457/g.50244 Transcript_26457/m.50244 type:complete len:251 (-) Transcript_26457:83-835(-)
MAGYPSSVLHEVITSACLAFTMNGSQMISKTIERHLPDVDGDSLTITLVFLNLAFFYSPLVGRLGQGAVMNPSTLTLRYFIGHMTAIKLFLNSAAIILGSFLGVTMVGMLLQYVPMEGVDLSPVRPTGGFVYAATAEFAVTLAMTLVGSVLEGVFPRSYMAAIVSAGVYCGIMTYEKCAFSCVVMNPAAPLALQLYNVGLSGFFSIKVWEELAPYVIGSFTASAMLGTFLHYLSGSPHTEVRRSKGPKNL